ncbi:MAG: phytanoyl-CoA dioxygenase family protein [Flavisolibacter sp.]
MIKNSPSDIDHVFKIPGTLIKSFRKNGHTLIRGVLTAEEVKIYREAILKAVSKYNTEKRKLEERDTYGKAFLQIMNLWRVDEAVKKFVLSKRFGRTAAQLLGVENVRIYHDQALFKEPGGGPTPWHQDQYYWPVDTSKTVTMWMPLVDIDRSMGMMAFASGSHTKGSILDYEISDRSDEEFNQYIKENHLLVEKALKMKAGDTSWHNGFTIHNASANKSDKMREVMTIIYIADGAKVTAPKNSYQHNDHQTWLKGIAVGNRIGSELNPLVL